MTFTATSVPTSSQSWTRRRTNRTTPSASTPYSSSFAAPTKASAPCSADVASSQPKNAAAAAVIARAGRGSAARPSSRNTQNAASTANARSV
jgi:hypothetical protein